MSAPDLGGVQAAIYAALTTANAASEFAAGGILDDVPEDYAEFPYVEIGEWVVNQEDASNSDGYSAVLTLRIWTRKGGQKAVHDIFNALKPVLHAQSFSVPGFSTCITQVRSLITFKPADGVTYPGTVRVEIIAAE